MNARDIRRFHNRIPVALGYVNPSITHRPDGRIEAHEFFTKATAHSQATIPQLRKGGVNLVVFSHGPMDLKLLPGLTMVEYMLRCFDAQVTETERSPHCILIRSGEDVARTVREDKTGVILHFEDIPINGDMAMLRTYYRLGARVAHIFHQDESVGGNTDFSSPRVGLKKFGREVIREMEDMGMILDLAHSNDRTFADVMKITRKPVIDSHTVCRSLADYARACTDDQLRAVAATGGVIGVHFGFSGAQPDPAWIAARQGALRQMNRRLAVIERKYRSQPYKYLYHRWNPQAWPRSLGGEVEDGVKIWHAPMQALIEQIDHMVETVGIDHVGIGADYFSTCGILGIESADKLANLTAALLKRGYGKADVRKIMGENWVRFYKENL